MALLANYMGVGGLEWQKEFRQCLCQVGADKRHERCQDPSRVHHQPCTEQLCPGWEARTEGASPSKELGDQEVKLLAQGTHALSHGQSLTPTLYLRPHATPRKVTSSFSGSKTIYMGFGKPKC